MPRNVGLILVVLFVVWQVVSAIIGQISTHRQQQQAEEIAKRRRQGTAPTEQSEAASSSPSRLDDLAARRKAQLEELRRRREAGKSAPTATQARTGGGAGTTARRDRSTPIKIEPATREHKTDPWQARQDAQRRERDAKIEKAKRDAQQRTAEQARSQKLATQERLAREQRLKSRVTDATAASALEAPDALKAQQPSEIRRRIHSPEELRQLFVLKELLDPPLAMRSDHG